MIRHFLNQNLLDEDARLPALERFEHHVAQPPSRFERVGQVDEAREPGAEGRAHELFSRARQQNHPDRLADALLERGKMEVPILVGHREQRPAEWPRHVRPDRHGASSFAPRGSGKQMRMNGNHQKMMLNSVRKMKSTMNAQMVMMGMLN